MEREKHRRKKRKRQKESGEVIEKLAKNIKIDWSELKEKIKEGVNEAFFTKKSG